MIHIQYDSDNWTHHSLVLLGHADYDAHGRDIVCAGVSAIVQALAFYLMENAEELYDMDISLEPGNTKIECEGDFLKYNSVFEMAMTGLWHIALQYPNHVTVVNTANGSDSREETAKKGA